MSQAIPLSIEQDPIFYADWYLRLCESERKIIQFLYQNYLRYGEMNNFPRISKLAWFARCTERNVIKFLNKCRKTFDFAPTLKIDHRFDLSGRQKTNNYRLSVTLKKSLKWLSDLGFLNSGKHKIKEIISSMRKCEKFTLPLSNSSPLHTESLNKDINIVDSYETFFKGIGIPSEVKTYLIKNFTTYVIQEAIYFYKKAVEKNSIKKSPKHYIIGTAKRLMEKLKR